LRVGNQLAVLNIEAFDFSQWIVNELGYDGEHLGGIKSHAANIESGVTRAV
jgi:hypothetical protein